jgi:hypothetical protein
MSFPDPVPGLVIRYSYLWSHEAEEGREEGAKDRPCAIVLSSCDEKGRNKVIVLPVTHSRPKETQEAVELPPLVKRHLGLDDARSWVVVSEANEFVWPGPDLRPLPGEDVSTCVYGMLPPRLFEHIKKRFFVCESLFQQVKTKRTV